MRSEVPVGAVEASAYTVPTDKPEADGTLSWKATTLVVVEVTAGGQVGLGWTYASAAAVSIVRDLLAEVVVGANAFDVSGTWQAMVQASRNVGRGGVVGMAISAVDVALWDLKARLLDLPLHRLVGGGACRTEVPVYGSGGFTTYSRQDLEEQLAGWLDAGMGAVKIKIGESGGTETARDLRRIAEARATIGKDVELFVDANGAYGAKQAIRMAALMEESDVVWFEEPVSSDDAEGLRRVRDRVKPDVAAGEYGSALASFVPLVGAVDCLQIDATRCGGYTEWLRVAALAAAHGLEVSAHCAPALHAPVAAVTPNLRHVEWFHDHVRIGGTAFDPAPVAEGGGMTVSEVPGHGLGLRSADLAGYRVA